MPSISIDEASAAYGSNSCKGACAHLAVLLSTLLIAPLSHSEGGAEKKPPSTAEWKAQEEALLGAVVVTATRLPQSDFVLPLSIDRLGRDVLQNGNAMVNLSESFGRIPGVIAQNRQNYAQDLQISVRGFGARSTFGVRGVRVYTDGVPATMPDGQGQTSHIDLTQADHIEVLRGPFSSLYGNSSGGVISIFTENGRPGTAISPFIQFGSYGTSHEGIKASGQQGNLNYVLGVSRFETNGYRDHSAATRDTGNAKLRVALGWDSTLTLVGNTVRMHDVQDPLGLTRAQMEANPRQADPTATAFNTRKSVDQQQLGITYEKFINAADQFNLTVYGGRRETTQYQAIPVAAQISLTSAGGIIDLSRQYAGLDMRWTHQTTMLSGPLKWTAGVSADNLDEDRKGYENFLGATLGVQGNIRRNETNRAYNLDEYVQAQWEPTQHWLLLAGLRNSRVHIQSDDHYVVTGNGNDSGAVSYRAFTPVAGATFKLSAQTSLYASYGKGFETPTLNELSYRSVNGAAPGFNFGLQPAKSTNIETGIKTALGNHMHGRLALFHIDTKNELAVLASSGGRAVYQNIGQTKRDGLELLLEGNWKNGVGTVLSYTLLRAVYDEPFCRAACSSSTLVPAGNRVPGVPAKTLYGELSWRYPAWGFLVAAEGRYGGKVYVDDFNSDAASSYFVANARVSLEQKKGAWTIREFVRIDNLVNRAYAASVIVNESNQRYFEPAPSRNYLAGVSAAYSW